MEQDYPSRKLDRFIIRLPDGMRERFKTAAHINGRSMNAEIVLALEAHLEGNGSAVAGGMSLRDYFAGRALTGICAMPNGPIQYEELELEDGIDCNAIEIAEASYRIADAMLAARSTTRTPD